MSLTGNIFWSINRGKYGKNFFFHSLIKGLNAFWAKDEIFLKNQERFPVGDYDVSGNCALLKHSPSEFQVFLKEYNEGR